eukprot:PITA_18174
MASSSHSHVYDIFINHRGPDVRNTVASHIYRRLKEFGLEVFLDVRELEGGENIFHQIEGAIRTASVHVAIFSPRYAESRWCLDELALMVESRNTIIPVFYGVQPAELRSPSSRYHQDLEIHEKQRRHDTNTIWKWREALYAASAIYGFQVHDEYDDYEEQIGKIVRQILKKVRRPPLNVAKYPTGLDEKIKDLEMTLSFREPQSGNGRVVGIVGPGGVGKSTLARELFNRWRSNYYRFCFLFDVRSKPLQSLQTNLLKDLIQSDVPINSVEEGIEKLRMHFSARVPSLIVLDDVDHADQLDALLSPVKDDLDQHSLILVTCRNMDVLRSSDIQESSIYQMKGLNRQHSSEVFCSYAFRQPIPLAGFEELVLKFLDVCSGSPLSLKVNGESLRGDDDPENWKAKLRRISKTLPAEIHSSLEISYNGLHEEDKQMFLDVACFFIGEDRDTVIRIWAGSGWEGRLGLQNLKNRCLVEVDSENRIRMDPHVRDIGRYEAEKLVCSRRLWRWKDNLLSDVSDRSPAPRLLRELNVDAPLVNIPKSIGELRFLEKVVLQSINLDSLPYEFRHLQCLKHLELKCNNMKSLPDCIVTLTNLQYIDLAGCSKLEKLPNSFENLTNLHHIDLSQCSNLQFLPEPIGYLKSLHHIDLSQCSNLQFLPESFGYLKSLHHIDLSQCSNLQFLPESFGYLTNLHHIDLSQCSNLQCLPDSVGCLTNLHHIDLSQCSNLQCLPDSFGCLTNVHHIDLSQCSNLQCLPDSFGCLTNLHHIDLSQCSNLQCLPDSFGCLTNVHHIDLSQCSNLQFLPDSFGCLTNLHHIDLSQCSNLQFLPDSFAALRNLEYLDLSGWSNLHVLPDYIRNFQILRHIDLCGCSNLRMLPDSFAELSMLRHIDITGCFNLEAFPEGIWERD